jgi:SAM-dependent methyltransferase
MPRDSSREALGCEDETPSQARRLFGYERIKKRKLHDTLEQHLAALLPQLAINCVVDVGANTGQFGAMLRRIGYAGRIVSFEPLRARREIRPATARY